MIFARARGASWQRVEGEMVLLDGDGGQLLGLNAVGGRTWELLDGARTVAEIVLTISSEFGEEPARVEADVLTFLRELEAAKLIVPIA